MLYRVLMVGLGEVATNGLDKVRVVDRQGFPILARGPKGSEITKAPTWEPSGSSVLPTAVAVAAVATIMTNVIIVAGSSLARVWVHVATNGAVVVGGVIW